MNNFPPSVCCGEKKAGGPIGTNSFGDSGFVVVCVCVKRETCKTETVLDFLGRVRCERCGFWILLLLDFRTHTMCVINHEKYAKVGQ